jgi:hypothetical protein
VHRPSPTLRTFKAEYPGRRDGEVRPATRQGDTYLFKRFDRLASRKLDDITPEIIESILYGHRRSFDAQECLPANLRPV